MKKLLCSLLIFTLLCLSGCHTASEPVTYTDFALDTVVSITLYGDSRSLKPLFDDSMDRIRAYEQLFSRTLEGSDIWKLNHANGNPVTVHPETISLLSTALYYATLSDGVVDPTIGTLSALWNFGDNNEGIVPSDLEIKKALSHVDYRKVHINGNTVTLEDPDAMLDLGFIAKGYIADQLKSDLVSKGIKSGIINLGGNVLTIGEKPDGSAYQVGIQKPFSDTGTPLTVLSIKDSSLVSSGNYERYFEKDGSLYHHILSTKTGYPADSDLSEVSISSSDSIDGDALSTLLFLLGYEEGKQFLSENTEGITATFVDTNGNLLGSH